MIWGFNDCTGIDSNRPRKNAGFLLRINAKHRNYSRRTHQIRSRNLLVLHWKCLYTDTASNVICVCNKNVKRNDDDNSNSSSSDSTNDSGRGGGSIDSDIKSTIRNTYTMCMIHCMLSVLARSDFVCLFVCCIRDCVKLCVGRWTKATNFIETNEGNKTRTCARATYAKRTWMFSVFLTCVCVN